MRRKFKKIYLTAGILLSMALSFTGCGNILESSLNALEQASSQGKKDSLEMSGDDIKESSGYIEEILENPDDSKMIFAIREVEGNVWTVTEKGVFSSDDKGSTWKKLEKESSLIQENFSNAITIESYAAISEAGKLAFYSKEKGLIVFENDGTPVTVTLPLESGKELYGMKFADEDTLVLCDTSRNIYVISLSDSNTTAEIPSDEEMHYYYTPVDGKILTVTEEGAKLYNYAGELQEKNEVIDSLITTDVYNWMERSNGGEIVEDVEKTGIFYASHSGLFHYMWGGSTSEQLYEGNYTKFGDDDKMIMEMAAISGNTVLCSFNDTKGDQVVDEILVRYDFSVTQEATKTLTLYTLYENKLLDDEINVFNQNNKDFHVKVEVGLTGDGGLNVDDAVKILNTEILAGTGPDIVILDGMNVDAYSESGMLTDLSDVLSEIEKSEGLYENIAYTYQMNGDTVCAVPARFQIPMMVGTQEDLDRITDFASLKETVMSLREANPGMANVIGASDTILLERLMTFCSPAWLDEEGKMNEAALRDFLETVKTINDYPHEGVAGEEAVGADMASGAMNEELEAVLNITAWKNGRLGFFRGNALNTTAAAMETALDNGLVYESAKGQSSNVFIPMQIVGVNANSSNKKLALEFVKEFLSSECQSELSVDYRGYPVNRTGFQTMAEDVLRVGIKGEVDWTLSEDELQKLFKDTEAIVCELKNRSITDTVITGSVKEEGEKYLAGEMDLETTVGSIIQKVTLHMSE